MNGYTCQKGMSKSIAWFFPVLFVLMLTFIFVLWTRTNTGNTYSVEDYSSVVLPTLPSQLPKEKLPDQRNKDVLLPLEKDTSNAKKTKENNPSVVEKSGSVAKETTEAEDDIPVIFGITPTYKRSTQKVDLTSLCHTLSLVPHIIWIVVEDASEKSGLVARLLKRCKVISVHMNNKTPPNQRSRGVLQRNTGLNWIREHCSQVKCNGVVYFMDDDNKYDLRLFEEMRKTERVSVFPVAFSGGLSIEGPVCENGKVVKWVVSYAPKRSIPIDMAGFAINVQLILDNSDAVIGKTKSGAMVSPGYLEPEFVGQFANRSTVECRAPHEVLVWHTKTEARIVNDNGPSEGFEVR